MTSRTINNCTCVGSDGSFIPFYTCTNCDNRFFDYLKTRDDELVIIREQNILSKRCNCIGVFDITIYCCSQCYNDLQKWIHKNSNKFSHSNYHKNNY